MSPISRIIKRDGQNVPYDKKRILVAIEKAFLSCNYSDIAVVASLADEVDTKLIKLNKEIIDVEQVQDIVESVLMLNQHFAAAKSYILYRERQKKKREENILEQVVNKSLSMSNESGEETVFDPQVIRDRLKSMSESLRHVDIEDVVTAITKQVYQGITPDEIDKITLSAVRDRIERHYDYSYLCSRLLLQSLYKKILNQGLRSREFSTTYKSQFAAYIKKGIELDMLDERLASFDLDRLSQELIPERDMLFKYLGMQIVADRYLLRDRSAAHNVYELPQYFWMRVAMGLALNQPDPTKDAISFYTILSKMDLVSSTPTLFNSGTTHSQMSSCYINITEDSLDGIFKLYSDNAQLSKWAGGIGTDWTQVRATGSRIVGTNGASQGVIPFIKIFNDVALAVNQGGKRKGAMCAYMEVWHADFEQYIELKKNTGDERRRAHDINTAAWIPDLFIKRVKEDGQWTFFCPSQTPELHDLYGKAFEEKYEYYESQNLSTAKTVKAMDLWRKMLTMLFETGHPWITFKDAMNVRNPQDHAGVIHSSNLCTEIALNTSKDETAVCNLASLNLANMVINGQLDEQKIKETLTIGIRMLDNVIDNNFYPTKEAKNSNLKHRPIGLGLMGYQDALYKMNFCFDSEQALDFADRSMEMISYYAISASSDLAKERGAYESYEGSKWSRGLMPYDTLALLEEQRGMALKVDKTIRMDWDALRAKIKAQGMRNSNTMAIAPTATIANISGVYPCTEPAYKNIYMKENLSGNFIVINDHLIDELNEIGLWTPQILNQIKIDNGSLAKILEIPEHIRNKYKEVFEIESEWVVKAAALRAKWIDQSASTNIFLSTTSGKLLNDTYTMAWEYGLKTTYYLRSLGATQIQKMTVQNTAASTPESTQKETISATAVATQFSAAPEMVEAVDVPVCKLNDPSCEACQ